MAIQKPKFRFRVEDLLDAVRRRQDEAFESWKQAKAEREAAVKARRKEVLAALSEAVATLKKGGTADTYITSSGAVVINGRQMIDSGYDLKALGFPDSLPPDPGRKPCFQSTIDMLEATTTPDILLTEEAYVGIVGSSCD